jgi:uncharacterized protein YcfJ
MKTTTHLIDANKVFVTSVVLFSMILSSFSYAGGRHHSSVNWAKVVRVEPVVRMVESRQPEKNCWNERVRYDRHSDSGNIYSSTILGGIIGGALGNAVGHKKKNKKVGTAVGAILGASIGSEMASNGRRYDAPRHHRNKRRCQVTQRVSYEEEVVAYRVWYRYKGEEYKTRMSHKPGKKIKVRVSVEPV